MAAQGRTNHYSCAKRWIHAEFVGIQFVRVSDLKLESKLVTIVQNDTNLLLQQKKNGIREHKREYCHIHSDFESKFP